MVMRRPITRLNTDDVNAEILRHELSQIAPQLAAYPHLPASHVEIILDTLSAAWTPGDGTEPSEISALFSGYGHSSTSKN